MNRIAVDQSPSGGSNYPLRDEHELSAALLDLFLSYDDETCEYVWPFKITELTNFDTASTTGRAVVITDAEDVVVFDTTEADYQELEWGDDRLIGEWYLDDQVLRLVWLKTNELSASEAPSDAVLDPRTYVRLPDRVRGIVVNGQTLTGDVEIEAGYNVATSVDDQERVDGGEFVERIQLDGVVGSGDGRLPGCEEVEPQIRRFNGVSPDASGNFTIETDGCIRQQLLLARSGEREEYVAEYAGDAMSSDEAAAALKLDDDCPPCCSCDSYVYTYRGLSRVWDRWADVAEALEAVRDTHSSNIGRWNDQRDCRLGEPLKMTATSQPGGVTFVGANFCNMSHCCIAPVEIRFTVVRYVDGVESAPPDVVLKEAFVSGTGIDGEVAYAPQIVGNVIIFRFDAADPQRTTSIRLRFCYASPSEGDSLNVAGTVHYPDPPPNDFGEVCVAPTPTIPTEFETRWAELDVTPDVGRAIAYRAVPITPQEATYPCTSCDCT